MRNVNPEQCLAHGGHQMNAKSIFQCLQVFAHLLSDTGYLKRVRENTGLQVCMNLSDQAHFTAGLLPTQSHLSTLWVIHLRAPSLLAVHRECLHPAQHTEVVSLGLKLYLLFQTPPVFMPEAETLICPQVPFLPLGHFFFSLHPSME